MKKMLHKSFIIVVLLLFVGTSDAWAQQTDITLFGGYQFGGNFNAVQGKVKSKDNTHFGVAIDIPLPTGVQAEVYYNYQPSAVRFQRNFGPTEELFDMGIHYFQVGGVYGLPQGMTVPYGVLTIGATWFDPQTSDYGSEWRFSATAGAGVKVFPSERIGIRLEGRLMMPFQFSGGSLWCGTGGCSVGIGTGTAILQGNVTGGLIIALPR